MKNRVTHRERGTIPGCVPAEPSFREFNYKAYWKSVDAYCQEIRDYIAHMERVRAGMDQELLAA